jgi:hypothetical protein
MPNCQGAVTCAIIQWIYGLCQFSRDASPGTTSGALALVRCPERTYPPTVLTRLPQRVKERRSTEGQLVYDVFSSRITLVFERVSPAFVT